MFERMQALVRRIPRGRVSTYGAVARAAGHPRAARLVVLALRQGLRLPWHRVVGAGGRILARGEVGWEQRLRLELEGIALRGGRVDLNQHGFWFSRPRPARTGGHRRR